MRRSDHLSGRMSALEAGEGSVAVLLHGFPLDARMWTDQVGGLAGPSRRVIAVDLRGHGWSVGRGDDILAMEQLAGDAIELIESLGQGAVDLVGLSMGGYVALAIAELRPDLVKSLGLVDSRATADTPEGKTGRDATAEGVVANGRAWLAETLLPKLVAEGASATVRARMRTMIEGQSYETIVADLAGMRDRPDRSAVLGSLDVPVGAIVGAEDVLTPPPEAAAMVELCRAGALTVIPGAGHMAPMEAPGPVNDALVALWNRAS